MQTLLIAEPSEIFSDALTQLLRGDFQIMTCADGETALELLNAYHPELLVLNIALPFKDGLTLLEETPYQPPVVLATTLSPAPYIAHRAAELGVKQLLTAPSPRTVSLRLLDLACRESEQGLLPDWQQQTVRMLHELNFESHREGYRQLCAGIPLFRTDPYQTLSKHLYPAIIRCCGSTSKASIETCIRRLIEKAWENRNPIVWQKYFPDAKKCPTSKAFIARLAEMLT